MALTYVAIVTIFIVLIGKNNSSKLNVPRVLLPYNLDIPTNYSLEVTEGGCYKWSSSRTDVATVTPLDIESEKDCSTRAVVSAISRSPSRSSTIVLAQEERTGEILRCDVIVDAIHSIEIITTTRELYLENAPEAFEVHAKNDQEDTFSSLEGVPFEWTVSDGEVHGSAGVIRFLKFADSPYETPPSIDMWEKQGLHGSVVLVEGVKTGTAKVRAKLISLSYKHVHFSEVNLMVVANLILNPASVFLLPHSRVNYRVELIKQGRAHEISMPSDQYYLEVTNTTVAQLNTATSDVTALVEGQTTIVLKDRNIKSHEMPRQPSGNIDVVSPSYMSFEVAPSDNWALLEQTTYVIIVKIFDVRHHRIYLADNIRVKVNFPGKHFHVKISSVNGTHHIVQTLLPGPCKIKGELLGFVDEDGVLKSYEPTIRAVQDVIIYQKILVTPAFVLLPWDPIRKPTYSIYPMATGGTGFYKWISSNTTIASVTSKADDKNKAIVTTYGWREVNITAVDIHNSFFSNYMMVSIQPVADLEIVPSVVEAEIADSVIVPLRFYGYEDPVDKTKKKTFDECLDVPIDVDIVEKTVFLFIEDSKFPPMGGGCRSLEFVCKESGHSRIFVKYDVAPIHLKTTAVIGCFKPLKPVHPVRVAVLPIGSSKEIVFEGGPRPWPMYPKGHYSNLVAENKTLVRILPMLDPYRHNKDLHIFRVVCLDLSETPLELNVGNEKSATIPSPARSQSTIKIVCGEPYSLHLKVKLQEVKGQKAPCPISETAIRVPVHNYKQLEVEVWVKDKLGRKFANVSSFNLLWELSDYTLAKLKDYRDVVIESDGSKGYRKVHRNYQVIYPEGKAGLLKVTVKLTGYRADVIKKENARLLPPLDEPLTQSIELDLVDDPLIKPDEVSVFNHPSNKISLTVQRGSGYFFIETSDPSKAMVEYDGSSQIIQVTPVKDGSITITAHDLCLEPRVLGLAHVHISGISAINVDMIDKVEVGKTIIATVEVLDAQLKNLPASVFSLMNLRPVSSSNIISVKLNMLPDPHSYSAEYIVSGDSLGQTSLTFIAGSDKPPIQETDYHSKLVSSALLPVQVFPPLQLNPRNITLVVGATFQVTCVGGPHPQSNIEYVIEDQNIATVMGAGIVTATKLGNTTLTARAVGYVRDKGAFIVYSKDQVDIYVVPLHGIRIHTPLTRIEKGTKVPFHAFGLNEHESPFAFGTAIPSLLFHWSVNNPEVASLQSVYHQSGIQLGVENSFAVRLIAHQPGHVTIRLIVNPTGVTAHSYHQTHQCGTLTDEIQIQVFDKLALSKPPIFGNYILISPETQLQLKSNRDGIAQVSYQILSVDQPSAAEVSRNGLLKSRSKTGEASLMVTAMEEFGVNQSMSTLVKVKPVSHLMINAQSVIQTLNHSLPVIPVGLTIMFSVSAHDDFGRKFHMTNTKIKYRPSRFDLVWLTEGTENGTLIAKALKTGNTVLKVWDSKNPQLVDYVNIVVGHAVEPISSSITVGDVICFNSVLVSREGHHGTWSSADENIIHINPTTAVGVALQPGVGVINYNISGVFVTQYEVKISPLTTVTIDKGSLQYFTNAYLEKPYKISVFLGEAAEKRKSNIIGDNCASGDNSVLPSKFKPPFECELVLVDSQSAEVSVSDIFLTKAGFDFHTGQYFCSIEPISTVSQHQVSVLKSKLQLKVYLVNALYSAPEQPSYITMNFIPGFHTYVEELVLSNIQPTKTIGVTGVTSVLECVVALPSDTNILEVLPPESDAQVPHTLLFTVRVRDISSLWEVETLITPLHVQLECSITKQKKIIPVKLKLIGQRERNFQCQPLPRGWVGWHSLLQVVWESYQSWFCTTLSIIGTLAAIFIGYRAFFGSRDYYHGSQSGAFLQQNAAGESVTPVHTLPYSPWRQPSSQGSRDVTGPQPQLWSVDNSSGSPPSFKNSPHHSSSYRRR
ncbi:nuclear pore membrane glycoprotein 210-like isoform X2 [Limulus polyphemus]|uniref:Nuclear pore membrane glycoprotein 210-like isoform X2 n=1 Tax=Limulus polyphemus TaxID=6850 RepID=A0ABM1T478_LIMPO|nr:nuclear pore membrane glycoprotein 210-like isoform X2 [Limulus polyphemus]